MPEDQVDLSDLRAADPVRLADLPDAQSPSARRLLTATTATTPSPRPARRRRLLPLGAVVAALAVVAAGFAVFGFTGAEPALAAVKAAAQEAAAANSGRVDTTFRLTGSDGGETGTVAGTAVLTYFEDDLAAVVELDELPAHVRRSAVPLPAIETRLVDGILYARGGGLDGWIAAAVPETIARELGSLVDPRAVLDTVESLIEAEAVGEITVDGEAMTHYRSVVDLGEESLAEAGWLSGLQAQLDVAAEGTITVDLYVDDDGRLRQLHVAGDVADAAGTGDHAAFVVSTVLSDFGAVPPIEAPDGVRPGAGLDGLLAD